MPVLPFVEMHGRRVACPHLNLYVSNAAVIVPIAGAASDADALSVIEAAFPGPGDDARLARRRSALHHAAGPKRRLTRSR
jgi:hypothetical protein